MNVLHVIFGLNVSYGGPPRGLCTLARAQVERGHTVTILACSNPPGDKVLGAGTHGKLTVTYLDGPTRSLFCDGALKAAMRRWVPSAEIVHIHGVYRTYSRAAAAVAWKSGVPYLLRPAGNLGVACRRHRALVKGIYWRLLEKRVADRAAALHCCSEKECREVELLGVRASRVLAAMPVDSDLRNVTPDLAALSQLCPSLAAGQLMILYVGRINWIKRLDVLVKAFVQLAPDYPGVALIIAGPFEDLALCTKLRGMAAAGGVADRVILPGMVEGAVKAAFYRRAAVFAQPSGHENFGQSVAEALAFGLPTVVSDGVALGEEIEQKRAGICCASEPAAFESALRGLLDSLPRRQAYGQAAFKLSRQFNPDVVCSNLDKIYQDCVSRHGIQQALLRRGRA